MLSEHAKKGNIATVPFEYLISTHVQMNASYEKLKEIIGESQALALFALAADKDLPGQMPTPSSSVEELNVIMGECGYNLNVDLKGDKAEFSLSCPHADMIHPKLGKGASFCPMSQSVLSAMRKKYVKPVVTNTKLVRGGSQFTIKVQE
jgi:hypothetical protein